MSEFENGELDWEQTDRDDRPPGAIEIEPGLVYAVWWDDGQHLMLWHWCTQENRWAVTGTGRHTLVSKEPLHLEPSVFWNYCCGLHGWVRGGRWLNA